MKNLSSRGLEEYRRLVIAEYQRRDDEAFRLRVRIADLEREVAQMTTRLRCAEAQSAAFRGSVENLAALIASVGLATGK
jgi:phage shock protein A